MSINPISNTSPIPNTPEEDISLEDASNFANLSAEEAHKRLVDTNKKYIFDNNKIMRGLSAGVQIGGIILMILAMIL